MTTWQIIRRSCCSGLSTLTSSTNLPISLVAYQCHKVILLDQHTLMSINFNRCKTCNKIWIKFKWLVMLKCQLRCLYKVNKSNTCLKITTSKWTWPMLPMDSQHSLNSTRCRPWIQLPSKWTKTWLRCSKWKWVQKKIMERKMKARILEKKWTKKRLSSSNNSFFNNSSSSKLMSQKS